MAAGIYNQGFGIFDKIHKFMAAKESKEDKEEREKKEMERERRLLFGGNPYAKPFNEDTEELVSKHRKKDDKMDFTDL